MGSKNDTKWIRPIKDNPAGKVVADPAGNRWEWGAHEDGTTRLLETLHNDDLAIEQTDIAPIERTRRGRPATTARNEREASAAAKRNRGGGHDAGGGFNPYDNSGKRPRR